MCSSCCVRFVSVFVLVFRTISRRKAPPKTCGSLRIHSSFCQYHLGGSGVQTSTFVDKNIRRNLVEFPSFRIPLCSKYFGVRTFQDVQSRCEFKSWPGELGNYHLQGVRKAAEFETHRCWQNPPMMRTLASQHVVTACIQLFWRCVQMLYGTWTSRKHTINIFPALVENMVPMDNHGPSDFVQKNGTQFMWPQIGSKRRPNMELDPWRFRAWPRNQFEFRWVEPETSQSIEKTAFFGRIHI